MDPLQNRKVKFVSALGRNLTVGVLLFFATLIPIYILNHLSNNFLVLGSVVWLVACIVLVLQYFFYFAVIGLVGGNWATILAKTRAITQRDSIAPWRCFMGPLGLTALVVAILSAPYPDGRSIAWSTLASAAESIFWLLSSYTGLAICLVLIDDPTWRHAGLDPYRAERIQTLEVQGSRGLAKILSPRFGVKLFLLATIVFVGNTFRQMTAPPTPNITIQKIHVADKRVQITVLVQDATYEFRGFRPGAFSLASNTGYPVSTGLLRAATSSSDDSVLLQFPATREPIVLYLEFVTERSAHDLMALEDLWLWYQLHPFIHLTPEMFNRLNDPLDATPVAAPHQLQQTKYPLDHLWFREQA